MKFRFYGWIVIVLLLLTGMANLYFKGISLELSFSTNNDYGKTMSYKVILFVIILLISGVHDFYIGNKALVDLQQNQNPKFKIIARWTGRLNLLLALIIALLGVSLSRGWV